jgi:Flp pilus assembly pilin Flp
MNPLNAPMVIYLRAVLAVRLDRARHGEDRSAGASAIEWAIITGLLALVAFAAYVIILRAVKTAAEKAETTTGQNPG